MPLVGLNQHSCAASAQQVHGLREHLYTGLHTTFSSEMRAKKREQWDPIIGSGESSLS